MKGTRTCLLGDCVEVMRGMAEASVDAIVTDPPYGLGFMGKKWDDLPPGPEFAAEALRVLKPGGHLLAFGGTRTFHRLVVALEDAGFEIRDTIAWLYGSGFPKSRNLDGEWEGWGTALKPAHEPIVVARRPLTGTVATNVLEHGTGAINVDGCRVATDDNLNGGAYSGGGRSSDLPGADRSAAAAGMMAVGGGRLPGQYAPPTGRWPANVVLDEAAAAVLDEQTGTLTSGSVTKTYSPEPEDSVALGRKKRNLSPSSVYSDNGGASRFFYCAKASRRERNAGLEGFAAGMSGPERANSDLPLVASPQANHHPTVKPVTLMRWLVRMVTPPGGTVLDPFLGSGTTGVAAALERVNFIGIEREAEYVDIARARIAYAFWGNE